MISVVIPTLNAAATLPACLAALLPATVDGLVRQVIISDGGSTDETAAIAGEAGADVVLGQKGRGPQLAVGAQQARADWLLFLHADTVLQPGWEQAAEAFMGHSSTREGGLQRAGYFRFRLDDRKAGARLVEAGVALRCRLLRLPYGDQGLLIPRVFYEALGGYRPMPMMEDVDLVDRIKKEGTLTAIPARAVTSAARYRTDGYAARVLKNARCIAAYKRGVPAERIAEMYR
ncbi:TIGR04283 family arsenosugar biosynthesis glycosyltransferase [Aquisalinus flavus]|uniref:Glycosyl transferase n=1 Tax=Aquisalinus flavus TaxID=1526572 RepID=A0A8J2Y2W4_9PROT|nr:TIGR04283 family arsenosugar biosynthesis glycosyltransferase [Aquisalinus flavus]MBD0426746.1 TIGR04283 family arsenosugar biosynthesis glycosyltransferase [Aquisalinus flavus]UNE46606.1 glycosyltransferase [Aquisalinus flavus]GGC95654.1 glycosyl transferase [Aquisalinus flavus]